LTLVADQMRNTMCNPGLHGTSTLFTLTDLPHSSALGEGSERSPVDSDRTEAGAGRLPHIADVCSPPNKSASTGHVPEG
jgi:hypothetical protein